MRTTVPQSPKANELRVDTPPNEALDPAPAVRPKPPNRTGTGGNRDSADTVTSSLSELRGSIRQVADPSTAHHALRFFKTGPGQYGEGDRFLGVRVPQLRALVRPYRTLALEDVVELLRSEWHEERLMALLLMVEKYRRGGASERLLLHDRYLQNRSHVNNWDLVDASAEHLVGAHLSPTDVATLEGLARSDSLWDRRIAIISTFHGIRRSIVEPTFRIADVLMEDRQDLIHKAVGWMLREAWKRRPEETEGFVLARYRRMPRTMLRYAIERVPEDRRRQYLAGAL
jgi:3-methyladenine DNA glycosylase AlkD